MRLYKRRGHWQVEFDHDGQRKRLAVGLPDSASKEDAQRAATDRMRSIFNAAPEGTPVTDRVTSMAEALNRAYLVRWRNSTSANQMHSTVNMLLAQIGHWMLKDLTYNKLLELQQNWLKQHKPATVNRKFSMIRTAVRMAKKVDNSVPSVEFPERERENNERDRYLTPDEEARTLEFLEKRAKAGEVLGNAEWAQMRDLYLILVDTGMRLNELLTLTTANLIGTSGKRRIALRAAMTKSKKGREIPLTPRAEAATLRWMTYPHRKQSWVQHRWKLVRREVEGIEDVNVHILRHTCAVKLLRRGVGIYTVSKWLGHSSVKVTERYSAVVPNMLDDALARLARIDTDFEVDSL